MSEQLTVHNFDQRREQGKLALSLVGMSNVGKSLWSGRLRSDSGFRVVGCDDEIEAALGSELQTQGYEGGIADVARWMGQPYDPQFADTQALYLQHESEVTVRALNAIAAGGQTSNLIIDTTGSVVHLDSAVRRRMRGETTVVYLEATSEMQGEMFQRYIEHPKPVVWGDVYHPQDREGRPESLRRLYPELLARRAALYCRMARVTIPRDEARALRDGEDFLEYVRYSL